MNLLLRFVVRHASSACTLAAMLVFTSITAAQTHSSIQYAEDFDTAWTYVRDHYAYFHRQKTDWERARVSLEPRARAARNDDEFIGVLELMLQQLYDSHAHLGVNTSSSPRLIPTGADVWAEHRDGRAFVEAVRVGSQAESAGVRAGMEVIEIDGVPVAQVVAQWRPTTLYEPDVRADDWALRAALAGRQNSTVRLVLKSAEGATTAQYIPGSAQAASSPLQVKALANDIGYVRVNNSLGDSNLVAAWDTALAVVRTTRGLILDLRDTPSGGNSAVARGLMGRLVTSLQPYQRHELPEEEREFGVKRIWVEYVAPRGPYAFEKPVVVLVGRWTGSMGEGIAIGLDGMRRATVIGTPMAGLLGANYARSMPHTRIEVRIPAERLSHLNGTPREDFSPERPVPTAARDDDEALAAALARLRKAK
jgi:C-terminal processing protease CtpA/Prc